MHPPKLKGKRRTLTALPPNGGEREHHSIDNPKLKGKEDTPHRHSEVEGKGDTPRDPQNLRGRVTAPMNT